MNPAKFITVLMLTSHFLLPSESSAAFTPVLNEIMAINDSTIADEDGTFSDWIEIRNNGDTAGNLDGWYLSDNSTSLNQWRFPHTPLAPGEIALVFASGKNRAIAGAELHANFRLSSSGEFLALTMPDGLTTTSSFDPSFPLQFADVSWSTAGYFTTPTPGTANSIAGSAPIQAVTFSPDSQVFSSSLLVSLQSPTPGATIIYTTDGSPPSSTNGNIYSTPFTLNTSTILRSRAQFSDTNAGPTSSRKFLRLAADLQSFSSPIPIIVLDNFGAGSVPQRNNSTGPNGNDGSGVFQVARQEILLAIFDRAPSGQASPANPPSITSNAGIRVRGSSSASLTKKPFSLETWQDGLNEQSANISPFGMPADSDWVLYAPTETFSGNRFDQPLLHNSFIYQLSNDIGRYATRTQFVEVFLNTGGGDLSMSDYAGLYIFIEQRKRGSHRIDFPALSQDASNGGWMINVDRMDPIPISGIGTPRHFHTPGPNQILQTANDSPFGVNGRDDRPEFYHSFFNFESPGGYTINTAQRTLIESEMNAFEAALYGANWKDPQLGYPAHIDVDNFVDHYILHNLTKNQDAFVLSTLLYRGNAPDKIKFGPVWDFDRGYTTSPSNTNPASDLLWSSNRMWFPRLFADPDFLQKYIDRWQSLREGAFSTANMHAIIDAQAAEITAPVASRNGTSNWPNKVAAMKTYLATRTAAIDAQFVPKPLFSNPGGAVPTGSELTISGSQIYYTTDGSDPRLPGGSLSPNAIPFDGGPVETQLFDYLSTCQFFIPTDNSLAQSWTDNPDNFDASTWTTANTGLGWENTSTGGLLAEINTNIATQMQNVNASGYFRWQFDFNNATNINTLTLNVKIDDGFIAYLNGIEIGRFNAPTPATWNSASTGSRSDATVLSTPINIDATPFKSAMRNGSNAIAIHAMNTLANGSDFLVTASLSVNHTVSAAPIILNQSQLITARARSGSNWSAPTTALFVTGTTANSENLVVSEIMYNPPPPSSAELNAGILDGDQFEFIELMNISDSNIDLSGVTFSDGIDFTFPAGSLLPAAQRVIIVKNLNAFTLRYGNIPDIRIAGVFANDTNLRDSGEQLTLTELNGATLLSFIYDDAAPWPTAADGNGYSLTLEQPHTNPDHNLPHNWHSSATTGGSPGTSGTETFTGDPFADSDNDGLNQLLEFATGSSDSQSSTNTTKITAHPNTSATFTFRRNLAATGIRYTVETSTDLNSWTTNTALLSETNLGDGTATLHFRLPNLTPPSRLYARLKIELE